jgi:hypothetical protein
MTLTLILTLKIKKLPQNKKQKTKEIIDVSHISNDIHEQENFAQQTSQSHDMEVEGESTIGLFNSDRIFDRVLMFIG